MCPAVKLIGITLPAVSTAPEREAECIVKALETGVRIFHLRKPNASLHDVERLLRCIPERFRSRIALHDFFCLADQYGVGGIHLNRRNPELPAGFSGRVSRSCHSLEELAQAKGYDYLFLSPIYDSLSKQGYRSAFTPERLKRAREEGLLDGRVMAWGGITPERIAETVAWGFGGVAVLGYLWNDPAPEGIVRSVERLLGAFEGVNQKN